MAGNLISCELPVIDDELEGGLEPGSLVYIIADSMAMAEIFLYYFVQNKTTYYFNTERKPDFIKENVEQLGFDTNLVKFIDVHKKYYEQESQIMDHGMVTRDYMILDFVNKELDAIQSCASRVAPREGAHTYGGKPPYVDSRSRPEGVWHACHTPKQSTAKARAGNRAGKNLVVDTITFFFNLNVKRVLIQELIDNLYNTTKKMGGLGFLYGVKNETRSHIENEVLNRCDAIFDISLVKKPDRIVTELTIPKARGRPIHGNTLKFKIENGVIMDTSREIA